MLLCTKPFDVLSQPPKPHFSMFIHTYISTHWYTHIQNHTDILQNCLKIRMFTQKFKKTCLLFNLIRCLKNNHLHFNVRNSSKAKKDFKKREKFLDAQCKKIVLFEPIFQPCALLVFPLFWMFSRLYSFINGQQEKSVIKKFHLIHHHAGAKLSHLRIHF